jgi:hypothetical protein
MTTGRFKDFGTGPQNSAPLSFKLYDEEFHCNPALQGKVLLDMVNTASDANESVAASLITDFFEKALLVESYTRFQKLLEDPEKIVTVEMLGQITAWLVEQYSGRPTQGPEQSQSGQ